MACSCRAKRDKATAPVYVDRTVKQIIVKQPQIKNENSKQSILQIVSDSISYDFSSTTQPTDLCYNCIRKHLSLAYILLEENDPDTFLMSLGEILCASSHLITTNQNLHDTMQNRVLEVMRGNKDHILYDLLDWIKNVQTGTSEVQAIKPSPVEANLIGLMTAYSLLFVEVSYEQLNKNWATAHLLKGAISKFAEDHNIDEFQNVRRIWKLIQSMQPYDQTYWDARKALKEELQKQWEKYKASLPLTPTS